MRKVNYLIPLSLILLISLVCLFTISYAEPQPQVLPSITFEGVEYIGGRSFKFGYKIISEKPALKNWRLYSDCFENTKAKISVIAEDNIHGSFEPSYYINPSRGYIEIVTSGEPRLEAGAPRIYYIIIDVEYYGGVSISQYYYYGGIHVTSIDYRLFWPPGEEITGSIQGPSCSPILESDNPLSSMASFTSLLAAIGLIISLKTGFISIKIS